MTIFILHGLGGSSQENWFPWAAATLRKEGHEVFVPDFPDVLSPTYRAWATYLKKFQKHIGEESVFIGHSLGCPFGIRYLAESDLRIAHFILTAPPFTDLGWPELRDMFEEFPPENATKVAKKFTIFASDTDPYIPLEHIRKYEELLGIKATILKDREHLWQAEMPEVVEAVRAFVAK